MVTVDFSDRGNVGIIGGTDLNVRVLRHVLSLSREFQLCLALLPTQLTFCGCYSGLVRPMRRICRQFVNAREYPWRQSFDSHFCPSDLRFSWPNARCCD
jgi:hypothetical protein